MIKNTFLTATLVAASIGAASAATVTNGSFEENTFGGPSFSTLNSVDSTSMPGWTVSSGSVDLISTYWAAQDGDFSLDMDGNSMGTIIGSITDLVVGSAYELSFWLSANIDGNPGQELKSLDAIVGSTSGSFVYDSTGLTDVGLGWTEFKLLFTAANTIEVLTFASTTGGAFYGAALDNVSVAAVPLPAGAPLLLAALAGLGLLRRRRNV